MGTYVSGVILLDREPSRPEIITQLGRLLQSSGTRNAILSRVPITLAEKTVVWYAVTTPNGYTADEQGELGRILSGLANGQALWVHYSDSTGRDAFKLFRGGDLIRDSSTNTTSRDAFTQAFEIIGAHEAIRDPEDLVDLLQSFKDSDESVWVIRDGNTRIPAEPYLSIPKLPSGPPLLNREFESLKPVRAVFRTMVWAFGGLVALLILWVVVWYLIEILR